MGCGGLGPLFTRVLSLYSLYSLCSLCSLSLSRLARSHSPSLTDGIRLGERKKMLGKAVYTLRRTIPSAFTMEEVEKAADKACQCPFDKWRMLKKCHQWGDGCLTQQETDTIKAKYEELLEIMTRDGFVTDTKMTEVGIPWGRFEPQIERTALPTHRCRAMRLCSEVVSQERAAKAKEQEKAAAAAAAAATELAAADEEKERKERAEGEALLQGEYKEHGFKIEDIQRKFKYIKHLRQVSFQDQMRCDEMQCDATGGDATG